MESNKVIENNNRNKIQIIPKLEYQNAKYQLRIQTIVVLLLDLIAIGDLCITDGYGSGPFDGKNMVDTDHLRKYPYCGSMYHPDASGRAVNAEKSKKLYRWVVYIKRRNYYPKNKNRKTTICSGTVITDR